MSTLSTRVAALFAVVAVFPVVLTALVWVGVSSWGGKATPTEAELAQRHLGSLEAQRQATVTSLCRDDLVVDQLLSERSRGQPPKLDYQRLFRGAMEAGGLQALWVLDARTGEILATGHRDRVFGSDGSTLLADARAAPGLPFVLSVGESNHLKFLVSACVIERGSQALTIAGAHRFTGLIALDPDRMAVVDTPRGSDYVLAELPGPGGAAAVVWRGRADPGVPPLLLWMGCVAIVALGLALLFGNYLSRWLQSSVDELTEAATRVGSGDLATTLREGHGGAFKATATAFNRMTRDLRNAQTQLRQAERIAAWQDIARRLAHELKNPLSPIRLSIETLRKAHARSHEDFDALFDESTQTILHEVERLRHIIDEFTRFARLPAPTLRKADLREIVPQAVSLYAEGDVAVSAELPGHPIFADIDTDQITQVLHNLLQNARDALRSSHPNGGGTVRVSLEQGLDEVRLRIEDDGPGIPREDLSVIFEPYFTCKEGGTGLGLAITSRIVTEHGGRIDVDSKPGRTVFTVVLPGGSRR